MNKAHEPDTLKIGVSGKRHIIKEEEETLPKLIENKIRRILKQNNTNDFVGYSALAIGADTIFAEVVINVFKMPLQIVLPMPVNEYLKDFAPADARKLTSLIEKNAGAKVINSLTPGNQSERNDNYFGAGKYIADNCDEVIFVWDELKPSGKGGTGEIMGYYSEKKNKVPVDYIQSTPANPDFLNDQILKEYKISNDQAIKGRDDYKIVWKLAIFLGWIAVFLFAISMAFDNYLKENYGGLKLIGVCLEFILVVTVFILIMKAKAKDYHGNYLKERLRAETLRVLRYFYHSNMEIKVSDLTSAGDNELSEIVKGINNNIQKTTYTSKWYAGYSIRSLIREQIDYHTGKIAVIGSKCHFFEKVNLAIAIAFIINLTAHLTNEVLHYFYDSHLPFYPHEIIIFLSIFLPASYAAVEGILYFQGWELVKKYSVSAKKSLEDTTKELSSVLESADDPECSEKQSIALNLVASIMLTDNRNWNSVFENKTNYHWVI